jgi:hypothetical protein
LELAADNREAAPGKGARYLPISMMRSSRPKGGQTTPTTRRIVATGGAAYFRKTLYEGFCANVCTPRPEGSSNGDHALPHRYPLSTCTPNIREFEPMSTRRLALETRVLDGRAIGGMRVRPLARFPVMYPGATQKKAGEMAGKTFQRGGRSASFCVW